MSGYYQTSRDINEKLLSMRNKNVALVYNFLLSQARFKPTKYYGININAGQYAVNKIEIAKKLKITIAQVRYALEILKKNCFIKTVINAVKGIKFLIVSICEIKNLADAFKGGKNNTNKANTSTYVKQENEQKNRFSPTLSPSHNNNNNNYQNNVNVNNISSLNNNISYIAKTENEEKFKKFDKKWKEISDYALENAKYTYSYDKYDKNFWAYIKKYEIPLKNIFKFYQSVVKNNIYIANVELSKYYRHIKAFCALEINAWNAYETIKSLVKMKRIHSADDLLHLIENPAKFKQLAIMKGRK